MIPSIQLFIRQFHREILLHLRQLKTLLNVCLFFVMLIVFFPLTLPPEPAILRTVVPGIIWIAVLLSFLLSSERIFQDDYEHGVIEQWLISGENLPLLIAAKILVHWLINVLPLLLLSPLVAVLFSLSLKEMLILALSLICGTPAILFLCALASVFGIGVNQRSALIVLILLPLTLPLMIFGSAALTMAMQGLDILAYLAILTAISLLAAGFLPFAIASVMRVGLAD
ncbi:heme exporter protein CcmB [Legionella israelensis]|uniref:heme exporter protein CcmB n=1 Tax=Legionella israelensis TaxID=454 RepID=UPI00118024D7|nr:heme exporter protein CcmB [Legionella israelensis]QDP73033.1 heme exporter protein CcmB [Legionella israelensis]